MRERPILFSAPMVRAILAGTKTVTRRIVKPQPELNTYDGPGAPRPDAPESHRYHWPSRLAQSMVDVRDMGSIGPYGAKGDRLWVRETWYCDNFTERDFDAARVGHVTPRTDEEIIAEWRESLYYRADTASGLGSCCELIPECMCAEYKTKSGRARSPWKPGIHMPRWASRITLEVVSVRVERLHEIDELDALAEGVAGKEVDGVLDGKPGKYTVGQARDAYAELWDKINGERAPWSSNPWVWRVEFRTTTPRLGDGDGEGGV